MITTIERPAGLRAGPRSQPPQTSHGWETAGLVAVLAVAACLNLLDLSKEGYANSYYAAAVKSMLQNWHNLFFVSFDPGGFVTVDKPPLGFWIQTASAKLFGFHGWSLLLPQALAGVASVLVLFLLVRRAFGPIAALLAAAALAKRPRRPDLRSLVGLRLNAQHQQVMLWGVWLLTAAAFFSVASFFHPYYLIMLAPPVAALAGIGAVELWRAARRRSILGWLLPIALLLTAGVQVSLLKAYPDWLGRLLPVVAGLSLLGAGLAVIALARPHLPSRVLTAATAAGVAGLLLTPAIWAGLTVVQGSGGGMPAGGPTTFAAFGPTPAALAQQSGAPTAALGPPQGGPPPGGFGDDLQTSGKLIDYLEANRGNSRFLLAVPSAMAASGIIIQTGQPVMAMGGFTGSDPILSTAQLAQDVKDGVVRFFLLQGATGQAGAGLSAGNPAFGPPSPGGFGTSSAAERWVKANCATVPTTDWLTSTGAGSGFGFGAQQLYDCGTTMAAS